MLYFILIFNCKIVSDLSAGTRGKEVLVTHIWNQGEGGVSDPAGTRRKEVLVTHSWNQEEGVVSDPHLEPGGRRC